MIIRIHRLKAQTILGIYPEERGRLREVLIDLTITYDHRKAIKSDRIEDALDYDILAGRIVDSLATKDFALLETLAEYVTSLVLGYPVVREVTVEIFKPGAVEAADSVSVVHTAKRL